MFLKLCIVALAFLYTVKSDGNKKWIKPDAWGRSELQKSNNYESCLGNDCSGSGDGANQGKPPHHKYTGKEESCPSRMEDTISTVYYKKLITFLFARSKLNFDDASGVFTRSILFTITSEQLRSLEKSENPRDWDATLSEFLPNIKTPQTYTYKYTFLDFSVVSFVKSFFTGFSLTSEVHFFLIGIAYIFAAIYFHKRYNYPLVVIIILGFFIFGFIYHYMDCNRKLAIDELGEIYDNDNSDPCKEDEPPTGWFAGFFNLFKTKSLKKRQCIEHLKKKNQLKLAYCRPDEVFLSYVNEVILNQFRMIIERCTDIVKTCTEKFSFPYNIIAMIIFGLTLTTFLGLIFRHILSPKVWLSFFTSNSTSDRHQNVQGGGGGGGDQLSGENLTLFLRAASSISINNVPQQNLLPSGVEELQGIRNQNLNISTPQLGSGEPNPIREQLPQPNGFTESDQISAAVRLGESSDQQSDEINVGRSSKNGAVSNTTDSKQNVTG